MATIRSGWPRNRNIKIVLLGFCVEAPTEHTHSTQMHLLFITSKHTPMRDPPFLPSTWLVSSGGTGGAWGAARSLAGAESRNCKGHQNKFDRAPEPNNANRTCMLVWAPSTVYTNRCRLHYADRRLLLYAPHRHFACSSADLVDEPWEERWRTRSEENSDDERKRCLAVSSIRAAEVRSTAP